MPKRSGSLNEMNPVAKKIHDLRVALETVMFPCPSCPTFAKFPKLLRGAILLYLLLFYLSQSSVCSSCWPQTPHLKLSSIINFLRHWYCMQLSPCSAQRDKQC